MAENEEYFDLLQAQVVRQDANESWGFRLQGGADIGEPIRILRVTPGSPADRIGLQSNDILSVIQGRSSVHLTHSQAIDIIGQQGNSLLLTVERKVEDLIPSFGENASHVLNDYPQNPNDDYNHDEKQLQDKTRSDPGSVTGMRQRTRPTAAAPSSSHPELPVNQVHPTYHREEPERRTNSVVAGSEFRSLPHRSEPSAINTSVPSHYQPGPQKTPFEFYRVQSKPFVEPPNKKRTTSTVPTTTFSPKAEQTYQYPSIAELPSHQRLLPSELPSNQPYHYTSEYTAKLSNEGNADDVPQSRTFRLLQSVMQNEEPASGAAGLPPPRSATMERMKREKSGSNPGRVKVLVSQKYNSPLGMYSAGNVIETFATQAENALEALEISQQPNMDEHQPVFSSK